ncbi:MAG: 3-phosphoserine/phosphohydroxythreonine transaminase [Candidatus Poseidoniia archaeon]|nr:3-phosphoserine/phosphohydroxythreonine transaminase [Candidatus Poseidoniia archaeon]MDP6658153.1 3-phosphoserine/phosphohydroxythreonine transaminase [Candidatus Poseidoniia archaeon]MDP6846510.1 3-phosphoserine/phosphohydroxythreonine transaminase [Candidatus Poseidoniia archaeon]MDP7007315.1 3-phosphoserine/phosphohydroxythreonine transaminase [Candidatus Poseidoniia archaeon]
MIWNFGPGPALLPDTVRERCAAALLDYEDGIGIGETSHRSPAFTRIIEDAERRVRELLGAGDEFAVLFLPGGASLQFSMLPASFLRTRGDYVVTGSWAQKAADAGAQYGETRVVASSAVTNFDRIPDGWVSAGADYLHICANNTIAGTQWRDFPQHPCLLADMSSEIMSRPLAMHDFGAIYAGAQKNLGLAGVTLVVLRRDLLATAREGQPPMLDYNLHATKGSRLNTPPTFAIFALRETLRWVQREGGLPEMARRCEQRSGALYETIDSSDRFYRSPIAHERDRSRLNVVFRLPTEELEAQFLRAAAERGMVGLRGHRSVGGVRASMYNAMPQAGAEALAALMREFAAGAVGP